MTLNGMSPWRREGKHWEPECQSTGGLTENFVVTCGASLSLAPAAVGHVRSGSLLELRLSSSPTSS